MKKKIFEFSSGFVVVDKICFAAISDDYLTISIQTTNGILNVSHNSKEECMECYKTMIKAMED